MNIKQKVIDGIVFDISDTGYVYRHDYIDGQGRRIKGKEIIPYPNTSGYLHFVSGRKKNGKNIRHMYFIHRLIAELFVENPNPNEYNVVDHIDGNKLNNNPTNLRWTNQKGNCNNPITRQRNSESLKKYFEKYYNDPKKIEERKQCTRAALNRPEVLAKLRKPRSEEAKAKMQMKGRIWVNNGTTNKFIKPTELNYYLNNGYIKGHTFNTHNKSNNG